MRLVLLMIASFNFLWILSVHTYPTNGMNVILDKDFLYFPDQAEYVKLATKCPENMILWPGTRRCYREGEQGPCNIDKVLTFDRKLWRPVCTYEAIPE